MKRQRTDSINSVYTAPPDPVSSIRAARLVAGAAHSELYIFAVYLGARLADRASAEKYAKYHDDRK
jgi:hypothetical protein